MFMKISFNSSDNHFYQSPIDNSSTQMLMIEVLFCLQNDSG